MYKSTIFRIIFITTTLFFVYGCSAISRPTLTVILSAPQYYKSNDGDLYIVRHGSLSDHSLGFVKIQMPGGNTYTLPNSVSGSGVRYTDNRELVWWEHQQTVRIDKRDRNGDWIENYVVLKKVNK
ncbi:hypothetical protein SOPP22_16800 [Shewanella sp. OPT22]|nr:hypothetical protein SOPP22_16800 [Shewanella sp. OPT22]